MNFEALSILGWSEFFAKSFRPYLDKNFLPGRVTYQNQHLYRVQAEQGELLAEVTGKLRYEAASNEDLPAVGDWVALRFREQEDKARIQAVLPRKSKFARKTVGTKTEAQIVGANVDYVFLVTSLNQDFNPRRLERYLASIWESGAQPVVILSKADLCDDETIVAQYLAEMSEVAATVPVHAVSVKAERGIDAVRQYCRVGKTIALVGTSGVGKSTLINFLLGYEKQAVKEVRDHDDRGQHTTRHRELIVLPEGGMILDTPGMREMQLWDAEAGMGMAFDDVEALAAQCRFGNCRHVNEPDCAVQAALDDGTLDAHRFENYLKLQGELQHLATRQSDYARRQEQQKWRKLALEGEARSKSKRKGF